MGSVSAPCPFRKVIGSGDGGMKRVFDIVLGCLAVIIFVPVLGVTLAVRLTSKGPALYWSDRVSRNNVIIKMPKFRSMRIDTPAVATHLTGWEQVNGRATGRFMNQHGVRWKRVWSCQAQTIAMFWRLQSQACRLHRDFKPEGFPGCRVALIRC